MRRRRTLAGDPGADRIDAGRVMAGHRLVDRDDVRPTEIEHKCDESFSGDDLEQSYNYMVYHFDCNGVYFWARAYIDEIDTVSVHGPFESRGTMNPVPGALDQAMLAYFKRRFRQIKAPGNAGYVVIWSR
jgi:hypothetical protein